MYSNRCCDRDFDDLISVNLRINFSLVMIFSNLLVVYLKQFLNNFFLTRLTYEYQFRWRTSKKTISSFFFSVNKFLLDEFGKILFSILSQEENLSRQDIIVIGTRKSALCIRLRVKHSAELWLFHAFEATSFTDLDSMGKRGRRVSIVSSISHEGFSYSRASFLDFSRFLISPSPILFKFRSVNFEISLEYFYTTSNKNFS